MDWSDVDWKEHCPIDEETRPVQRQAFRAGWEYRAEHGSVELADVESVVTGVLGDFNPRVLSVWIRGYSAADNLAD